MKNVLELFEKTVCKFPEKIAIAYQEKGYTFNELMLIAKQIGNTIRKTGLRNHPIGVFADRDIETISFFLGVLYSGNYYVPIDPEMPEAKIQHIITDSSINVILGKEERKNILSSLKYTGDFFFPDTFDAHSECDIPENSGQEPLYMVYTSGSTGAPKGVLKSHASVINYIEAYCDTFDFSSCDIIGNQTPFYFDASAKDIYMMINLGCTMEILPTSLFSFPPELMSYLNEKRVTFVSWVPSVLSIVAQLNPFSLIKPETLKKVFFVGEVMPMKHLNKWREALPEIEYVNLYGQSEIAGICCYYEVEKHFDDSEVLPIGKPLKNCRVYLLNDGKIVDKPEQVGELYIVSEALATCYYNDEDKTKSKFVYHDFGQGSVRCFKTGDLFKYDNDGNLIFSSRSDYQVKHMGYRIELGEIETVANELTQIHSCCCLYNNDKKRIVLFCQLTDGTTTSGREIQSILRHKLSSYMLPSKVVVMDKLPINANGKINRQYLKEIM